MPNVYIVAFFSYARNSACPYALPRYMTIVGVFADHVAASTFRTTAAIVPDVGMYVAIASVPLRALDSDALVVAELCARARAAAYGCTCATCRDTARRAHDDSHTTTASRVPPRSERRTSISAPSLDVLIETLSACNIEATSDEPPPSLVCSPRTAAAHSLATAESSVT